MLNIHSRENVLLYLVQFVSIKQLICLDGDTGYLNGPGCYILLLYHFNTRVD